MTDTAWHADRSELLSFAHVLVAADWLDSPRDTIDYFDKPYAYDDLHAVWRSEGSPTLTTSHQWARFVARIEAEHE